MYTEGIMEAFGKNNEEFSEGRLKEEAKLHSRESIKDMVLFVLKKVKTFTGEEPQSDDITLLGIKYFHASEETK